MLERRVKDAFSKYKLLEHGDAILVGVSGGPDSLALLHFLCSLKEDYDLRICVAHVDHMFRGSESFEDYIYVKELCKKWGVAFKGARRDVPKYIKETGKSSQTAAREMRFRFFEEVMKEEKIHRLFLGHHGDDQIETMLMRLTRGASGTARAGIAMQRQQSFYTIIRPFLWITKQEILDYCKRYHLEARLDPSNEKPVYSRNRFRLHVLPFLKEENQNVHSHFQRFSQEIFEDEAFLRSLAEEELKTFWKKNDKCSTIQISPFLQIAKPLQRRCIQLILNYLYNERQIELSATHIDSVLMLINNSHPSGVIHLPAGLKVLKSYDQCTFRFNEVIQESYSLILHIPGETLLPNGRKIIAMYSEVNVDRGNDLFVVDPAKIRFPLTVRSRKNGDRMKLKGLDGSRKVKDIFIDTKIPLVERALWPIVEDNNQEIIWLPGLKKSDKDSKEDSTSFITLKYV